MYTNSNFKTVDGAEPVGVVCEVSVAGYPMSYGMEWFKPIPVGSKLYLHPAEPAAPQEPLTEAKLDAIFAEHFNGFVTLQDQRNAGRAIEAAHGITKDPK